MNLLTILLVLFVSLFVVVTLLERFGKPMPEEQVRSYTKWIFPLVAILLILQLLQYFFGR